MAPAARTSAAPPAGDGAGEEGGIAGRTGAERSPSVPDLADDLADMLRRGRLIGARRVVRLSWVDDAGQESSIALPPPTVCADMDDDSEPPLSDLEQGIMDVLRRHPTRRMTASEIAPLVDEDEDPYGGTFKRAISRLKLLDLIDGGKKDGGYALKTKQK